MKKILCFSVLSLFITFFSTPSPAQSPFAYYNLLLTVNQTADTNDAAPGDGACADAAGRCSLRAAVQESNALTGGEAINFALPHGSTINLTAGTISVSGTISIIGPGARNLTVTRAGADFRIFSIVGSQHDVEFRNFTIKNGSAGSGQTGGAIDIEADNIAYLTEMAISDNAAGGGGGGIANAGVLYVTRSLMSGNSAAGSIGGALLNFGPEAFARVTDTTITNNSAGAGGGISNVAKLELANTTITNNSATGAASSVAGYPGGEIYVVNSIIGRDSSAGISSLTGYFSSLGHNIVTDAPAGSGFTDGTEGDQVSQNNAIDPRLGPLADNGGQTDTRALLAGSPAIDHGSNCVMTIDCGFFSQPFQLNSDQRTGYNRYKNGTADIGAFEFGVPSARPPIDASTGSYLPRTIFYGSMTILTNARTNEKRYALVNPAGYSNFLNVPSGDVYIYEIKRRRGAYSTVSVLDYADFPFDPTTELTKETGERTIELKTGGKLVIGLGTKGVEK